MLSHRAPLLATLAVLLTSACGNHNYQGGGRRHELPVADETGGTSTSGSVTAEGESSNNGEGGVPTEEGLGGGAGTAGTAGGAGGPGATGGFGGFSGGPGLK